MKPDLKTILIILACLALTIISLFATNDAKQSVSPESAQAVKAEEIQEASARVLNNQDAVPSKKMGEALKELI